MPVEWSCDACGRHISGLTVVFREYRRADYKTLCRQCATKMDDASLVVFSALKQSSTPPPPPDNVPMKRGWT